MSIERERLISLIEYAQHSARLRSAPVASVTQHGLTAIYEHQLQSIPGIAFNSGTNDDDEIWLAVKRLHETPPPELKSAILKPWIELTQSPTDEPKLRKAVDGASLVAAGTHRSSLASQPAKGDEGKPSVDPRNAILLDEYEAKRTVSADFHTYLDGAWKSWSEAEKLNRRTIRLYAQLFTLKQQLEGIVVEAQLELVWGVGLGIWKTTSGVVGYPLITRLVEITLNPTTAAIEIRPRDVEPRLEVDWYAATDNPGVAELERAARDFFGKATSTFSPFDRGTYEGLLRSAVSLLESQAVYWPDQVPPEDRTLPQPEQHLKVTDTWVLFARPRTQNLFVQDLEKLKTSVASTEDSTAFPSAVAALVTEPETHNQPITLPCFRGISATYGYSESGSAASSGSSSQELFFPKAFNDEQVRIVQLLQVCDGVAVQGPPGTGKTHTIANIICHYLAQGKRVLVTSMKDPALAVLRQQLPAEIQPLAISLLTSEQEGMKQFEFAIQKIASEVQALDRIALARHIQRLDETIEALHGRLSLIDRSTTSWAQKNLARISLDGELLDPPDAARELVANVGQFEWIPDPIGVESEFSPRFSDSDVVRLREARKVLGHDLDYLTAELPQLIEFSDSTLLLQAHQDLSQFQVLKKGVLSGEVPALADSSPETLSLARQLLTQVEDLQKARGDVLADRRPWTVPIRVRLRSRKNDNLLTMLEALGADLMRAHDARAAFIERPVNAPPQIELEGSILDAIDNIAKGKSAFGLRGVFGKTEEKRQLAAIRVLNAPPADHESWAHVAAYLRLQKTLRSLATRWNALARELEIDTVPGDEPEHGIAAMQVFGVYRRVASVVQLEKAISDKAARIFPTWVYSREIADSAARLVELERALRHHLTQSRLANVWAIKEQFQKVLTGKSGRVVIDLRRFVSDTLGNPTSTDAAMQAAWSSLMVELSRVHGLSSYLGTVREICDKISASGAPTYASTLKQPLLGPIDTLLPDHWRKAWRLKRIDTYLNSVDAREDLEKLAKDRRDVEGDLARAYKDVVVKRTWLKLAENASPSIRAALQAYLNAIQRIGKGTGKRAVRYRQDARAAAARANPAVPCWIMPHYRVSESLPPELGCFDLVVIDEASQSDLTALPALLRADKVLIVGDDKQVSPEGIGIEEQKILSLMNRFLTNQVSTYRPQMSPERSIYDLYRVVFAKSLVMLREHFRCVPPIIEYSKREFYNHELRPLRIPRTSERLDPPLVDVVIQHGHRKGDINLPEARFIVDEIKTLLDAPSMSHRSMGVVSLLGDKQALKIWERLTVEVGPEAIERHNIACGDARTFQGKERDIMFLSMVVARNDLGVPLSRDAFAQRFNVAASRARDRMYLVRSVELEDLSDADRLRRSLITHFTTPFVQDEERVIDLRKLCESPFEREMYDELTQRGYWVRPQVRVGQYRIDLVVEGVNDARLAIECDGDKYHGADKWSDDMQRQRVLERAGWTFWRCFASEFVRRRASVLEGLLRTLSDHGIEPVGAEGAPRSVHTERRVVIAPQADSAANTEEEGQPVDVTELPRRPLDSEIADSRTALNRRLDRIVHMDLPTLQSLRPSTSVPSPSASSSESPRTPGDPSEEVLAEFCRQHQLQIDDKRAKGGRLWVTYFEARGEISAQLRAWGFQFVPSRGYWHR